MNHQELVERGEKWLRNTEERCLDQLGDDDSKWSQSAHCTTVVAELHTHADETPDVIGWKDGRSVLIECKTSRSDYYADMKKTFRQHPPSGMGDCRFYLTPAGLLAPQGLPEFWGLLEVQGRRVVVLKNAVWQESDADSEKIMLCSMIRRLRKCK